MGVGHKLMSGLPVFSLFFPVWSNSSILPSVKLGSAGYQARRFGSECRSELLELLFRLDGVLQRRVDEYGDTTAVKPRVTYVRVSSIHSQQVCFRSSDRLCTAYACGSII